LKRKIITSLFALFLFFTAGTVIAVFYMSTNITELKKLIQLHEVEQLRRSLIIKLQNVQTDLYAMGTPLARDMDFIVAEVMDLEDTSRSCLGCHHPPALEKKIKNMQNLVNRYENDLSAYITASANAARINRLKQNAADTGERLLKMAAEMSHSATKNIAFMTDQSMQRLVHVKTIMLVTITITFLLGIIVAIHLTRSVTRPVSALVEVTRNITSGELGAKIQYKDSTEFGELAEHFNMMSATLKEGYEKIQREVSERRQAEEALRVSEEMFRSFFEMSPLGIIIYPVSPNPMKKKLGNTTYNPAFHTSLGYTREEMDLLSIEDVSHPDDLPAHRKMMDMLLDGRREGFTMEKRFLKKNGDIFWGYLHVSLMRGIDDKPSKIMTMVVDITLRKKMEEEQLKIEKLESLGILAGGIAHDFNNILTSIMINLTRVRMASPDTKVSKIVSEIEKACNHAKDLTSKFITFSKGGSPVKKIISIRDQLRDSTLFALQGSRVRCQFFIADDLWHIEADESQINQVILNLVINAKQAMPEGGFLFIEAENIEAGTIRGFPLPEKDFIRITFRDQGSGILPEHLPKIFDPYFTTKQEGSGLGLSSAYSIVKNHDGFIDVDSSPGSGTAFYVYLPAVSEAIGDRLQRGGPEMRGEGRILLMDDDRSLRNSISRTLMQMGYEVEIASDGKEAIEKYRKAVGGNKPFDVVILDLTVAVGMGGKEAIKELLKIDPGVRAIVSSGYSDDALMSDFRSHGFMGVISKPYDINDLHNLVASVIKSNPA
jgi:PAS domain S-box-containing protein